MRPRWIVVLGASVALLVGVAAWIVVTASSGSSARDTPAEAVGFTVAQVYTVTGDGALEPAPDARAAAVWDELRRVVTPEFAASSISQYHAGDDPNSDTLAYVSSDEDDVSRWVFAANLAYADDTDLLLSTLVHEYAHMLSLGTDDTDPDATTCDTEWAGAGCLLPDADLERFAQRFWSGYTDAPARDNVDADVASEFYGAHEEDFVSDYAATNASEDFAETFATYVVEPDGARDSVIAEKFAFFAGLPEYSAARDRIRAEFDLG